MIKFILAAIGFRFGLPGVIGGFIIGYLIEKIFKTKTTNTHSTTGEISPFLYHLLILVAATLKANGYVVKSEVNFVKQFLVRSYGVETTKKALLILRDLLKQNLPLQESCQRVSTIDYHSKLQLINFLFGISQSNGDIDDQELKVLERIARLIGLTQQDFMATQALFIHKNNWAYDVLEISENATEEEIKRAWKVMAIKHHPDKVAHLGEEVQKAASQKMQRINEAYEYIKKIRNFN